MKPLIVIAGPTATGKTSLSVELAKKIGGEIVCADSMQVYQFMEIGSASPNMEERQRIPHHLFGIIHPKEQFSLARYVELAHKTIADIHERGKIPVMVGGTGLYIDTVTQNITLTKTNEDAHYRDQLQDLSQTFGKPYLHQMLAYIDPEEAKKLAETDTRRIIRALEIYKTTGITKTEQNRRSRQMPSIYHALQFGVHFERDVLYNRINQRVDQMLEDGLLEEVAYLFRIGVSASMTAMQGIGYKELAVYLKGNCSKEEAIEEIKKRTRNYAKRQMTWFRRNEKMIWLDATEKTKLLENCLKNVETMLNL